MSLRRSERWLSRAVAFTVALVLTTAAFAQDRTADWLDANGLDSLLALHLERERVESAGDSDDRRRLAIRLAEVYARQLKHERDPDTRKSIIIAAEHLLETGEADAADTLRLALF